MAMKGYYAFHKAPPLKESYHQIDYSHIPDTRWGVLPLGRYAVGVFYNPGRLVKVNNMQGCVTNKSQ